jgi:hypothetical protein
LEGEVELLADVFADPPEAAAEDAPGATLYIRVPASLKDRADRLARDEEVSLNAWAMRCVERCTALPKIGECIGEILHIGESVDTEFLEGEYSTSTLRDPATLREIIAHITHQAKAIGRILGWNPDHLMYAASARPDRKRWQREGA